MGVLTAADRKAVSSLFAGATEPVRVDVLTRGEADPEFSAARLYAVNGVPKTVFGTGIAIEGAVPEGIFLKRLLADVGDER